jgi:hypothetical protein
MNVQTTGYSIVQDVLATLPEDITKLSCAQPDIGYLRFYDFFKLLLDKEHIRLLLDHIIYCKKCKETIKYLYNQLIHK